jgi:hypothetical protein
MSTFVVQHPALGSLVTAGSPGVGADHQRLVALLQDTVERLLDSVSLGKPLQDAYRQLYQVLEECGRSNWNGYGAQPVLFESYERAKRFVRALPFGIPMPEVSAEPDGEITFEWFASPTRVFSVSVGPNNELNYAGLFGASRTYGTEVFHDEIPDVVLSHIKRVAMARHSPQRCS